MPARTRHLYFMPAMLGIAIASISSLRAQSAAELERGGRASSTALAQADHFKVSLDALLAKTKSTIITLQASLDTLRSVGLDQAATDIAAILEAAVETEQHLTTQVKRLTRLRTDGATESTDPLMVVLDGIAAAKPKSNSRNRLQEQEAALNEFVAFIAKEERLAPFTGLVHYHIGEVQFRQAKASIDRKLLRAAKPQFLKAIKSFKQAADDSRPDVKKAGVGTSLRATSIYYITKIHAALGWSVGLVSASRQRSHQDDSRHWFRVLADEHREEKLEDGRNVVRRAQDAISEVQATSKRRR